MHGWAAIERAHSEVAASTHPLYSLWRKEDTLTGSSADLQQAEISDYPSAEDFEDSRLLLHRQGVRKQRREGVTSTDLRLMH